MTKSKRKFPQELTDEELMQVTGGARTKEEFDRINSICKEKKEKDECEADHECKWMPVFGCSIDDHNNAC